MRRIVAATDNRQAVARHQQRRDQIGLCCAVGRTNCGAEFGLDDQRRAQREADRPKTDQRHHDERTGKRKHGAATSARQARHAAEQRPDQAVPARREKPGARPHIEHGQEDIGQEQQGQRNRERLFKLHGLVRGFTV